MTSFTDCAELSHCTTFSDYTKEFLHNDLAKILDAIKISSILIEQKINRSAFDDIQGNTNNSSENSSGDVQKKLDVISNDIMIEQLTKTGCCSILLSEENEDAIIIDAEHKGNYMVAFDPLDGSSNIDCNCCIGTIFSVYEDFVKINSYGERQEMSLERAGGEQLNSVGDSRRSLEERICKTGDEIICAGYVLYGPSTELVITIDNKFGQISKKGKKSVQKFTLDRAQNEYLYTGEIDITNKTKKIYSINEGNYENWFLDMKAYINQYKGINSNYAQRYIGSMVADVHRTLLYGGMFGYPADKKNTTGKLRVIYECFPISKIIEAAGGAAIIGHFSKTRILEIKPKTIHERTSIILGSKTEIDKYIKILLR